MSLAQEQGQKPKPKFGVWIRLISLRLKQHWLGVVVGGLTTAIILSGQAVHSGKQLWEVFFPKPDALSLTQEAWKDAISRDFVEAAYRRLFWSRSFLARVRRHAHGSEINEAWKKLIESMEYMNMKVLVYAAAFEQFYDIARRIEFENGIQNDFATVTQTIVDLRYSDPVRKLEFPNQFGSELTEGEARDIGVAIASIDEKLEQLQTRLYQFSNCFDKQSQTLDWCRYLRQQ
jgi:hypothetical protein